jgi:hypothetical protein
MPHRLSIDEFSIGCCPRRNRGLSAGWPRAAAIRDAALVSGA